MVNYDAYATTFSNSRKDLKWPELDAIIEDMRQSGYTSVLDVGCGNGRFLETWNHEENSEMEFGEGKIKTKNREIIEESKVDDKSKPGVRGEGTVGTKTIADKKDGQSEEEGVGLPLETFGTFGYKSTENSVWKMKNYLGIDNSAGMIAEARKLHPDYQFEVCPMESLGTSEYLKSNSYDAIVFLASFHHLETREERIQVVMDIRKYLAPGGAIYMTNWNLRDQPRYQKSHRGDGDYDIKIGEYTRYYHGFTVEELEELFQRARYQIVENTVFEGGRNIWSKITH